MMMAYSKVWKTTPTNEQQLIVPSVEEVLKTVPHKPPFDVLKRIPLSINTVQRCTDEMNSYTESFLCNYLQ